MKTIFSFFSDVKAVQISSFFSKKQYYFYRDFDIHAITDTAWFDCKAKAALLGTL